MTEGDRFCTKDGRTGQVVGFLPRREPEGADGMPRWRDYLIVVMDDEAHRRILAPDRIDWAATGEMQKAAP